MSLDVYLVMFVDTGAPEPHRVQLANMNITHNVSPMWRLVGVRDALYESEGKTAGEVLTDLRQGLERMRACIDECRALNPENGWGNADDALAWLEDWIALCERHPKATIEVWA